MIWYSIKLRAKKYIQGYGFLLFARNLSNRYGKQWLETAGWLDSLNMARCFKN